MGEKLRILVAAPIFDGMEYCIGEFIDRIKSLDYDDYDVLLVDNSTTNLFSKGVKKKYNVDVIYLSLDVSNMKKIVRSRNKILTYAVNNSYDYVLMMDCDVIPPVDILGRLLAHEKDVVSGLYYGPFGAGEKQKTLAVAWKSASNEELEEIKSKFPKFVKTYANLRRHLTEEEIESRDLQEVIIPSAGCMLIGRDVFKKIKYGILDVSDKYRTSDDIFFCKGAREAGFKLYCDPSVKCEHLIYGKFRKDGGVLMHPAYE